MLNPFTTAIRHGWTRRERAFACLTMMDAFRRYFTAPKRLSNEFGGTIGAEPET